MAAGEVEANLANLFHTIIQYEKKVYGWYPGSEYANIVTGRSGKNSACKHTKL